MRENGIVQVTKATQYLALENKSKDRPISQKSRLQLTQTIWGKKEKGKKKTNQKL
jgi:hypothetical protein